MKRALITGVTGQDGSYLAEYLLSLGYKVYALARRSSTDGCGRIVHILDKIILIDADLLDQSSLINALKQARPVEIYNLASQSFVPSSFSQAVYTGEVTALGVTRMLEAMRLVCPQAKFYQASSSEMFGKVQESPQNERTPFHPRSPYGVAKLYGHWMTINYREAYNLFAVSGILFNHESPRRGTEFVTRKISLAVARIKLGKQKKLVLGNLEARRDWGFAGDYVKAMHLMLQQKKPSDFVVGTGKSHSVKEFVNEAFKVIGVKSWQKYVETSEEFIRPAEVERLVADPTRAKRILGWKPEVNFRGLVKMMVEADVEREKRRWKV
jgi:GDPmannose 4,6-dehydratase